MEQNYLKRTKKQYGPENLSVTIASFISALFLSAIGSIFYNMIAYEKQRAVSENGNRLQMTPLIVFYVFVMAMVSVALIMIIYNAFAFDMNRQIRQIGILSSVGATPRQIRKQLISEAVRRSMLPAIMGYMIGLAASFGFVLLTNFIGKDIIGRVQASFRFSIGNGIVTVLFIFLTIWMSSMIPARKLSKISPLVAIKSYGEFQLKKKVKTPALRMLFGVEGELAGTALCAQKKAFRTSTVSLTLSFLGFTLMLCFLTLSQISTNHTYFERYQDDWDVMVTVKNTDIVTFAENMDFSGLTNTENITSYQKVQSHCLLPAAEVSKELENAGGVEAVAGSSVIKDGNFYRIPVTILIMDDAGFHEYCKQIGTEHGLTGAVVLNKIWDSTRSNFRYKEYLPYVSEERKVVHLLPDEKRQDTIDLPVQTYTQTLPPLREEYQNYALVYLIPVSLWETYADQFQSMASELYVRVLTSEKDNLEVLEQTEKQLSRLLDRQYTYEIENRIREKQENDQMMHGFMLVIGIMCAILAMIGIANVFSNTLGFVTQRRREFARYISVGMTPESLKKMFMAEIFVIAGRPIFITIPITIISVWGMINASYLNPAEFMAQVPLIPMLIFMLAIVGFVTLAYYFGTKKLMSQNLMEEIRMVES